MGDKQPIWVQQPDEPARWYGRFELYRIMGPNRSLDGAFRLAAQLAGLDPHAQRLAMVDELLQAVHTVLVNAKLDELSKEEARRALPTLRMFFRDLLVAHRDETARCPGEQGAEVVPFSADELREAQGELVRWRALWEGAGEDAPPVDEVSRRALRDVLATLYPDEASIRRVTAQAQLEAAHIGFSPRAVDTWHAVLLEAAHSGRLEALMDVAASEYRGHRALRQAVTEVRGQLP